MGRSYQALQGLLVCAYLLLLYEPIQLFDISFQLSFLASLGILLFYKTLYLRLTILPKWLRSPLVLCFSAQILLWPITIYYFHTFSIITFLANLILGPFLEFIIIGGVVCLCISLVWNFAFLWFLLNKALYFSLILIKALASIRGGTWWIGHLQTIFFNLYYFLLFIWYNFLIKRVYWENRILRYEVVCLSLLCLCLGTLLTPFGEKLKSDSVQVHTVPLGQQFGLLIKEIKGGQEKDTLLLNLNNRDLNTMKRNHLNNSLHYMGIYKIDTFLCGNLNKSDKIGLELFKKYWQIKVSGQSLYFENKKIVCYLGNRQRKRKKLKLDVDNFRVIITDNIQDIVNRENTNNEVIIFCASKFNSFDLEPEMDNIYIVGKKLVPDLEI